MSSDTITTLLLQLRQAHRVSARAQQTVIDLTDKLVSALEQQADRLPKCPPDVMLIQQAVCAKYGITRSQLIAHMRPSHLTRPRHVAMMLCDELLRLPRNQLRFHFQRRANMIEHAVAAISSALATEPRFKAEYETLKAEVQAQLLTPTKISA